jgi:hypothetical protein
MSAILRRRGPSKLAVDGPTPIPEEGGEGERGLDKTFGYAKNFGAKYELGKEVGRGHFGHTCWAKGKKGELKGHPVAVKIISKAKVCCVSTCVFVFVIVFRFEILPVELIGSAHSL